MLSPAWSQFHAHGSHMKLNNFRPELVGFWPVWSLAETGGPLMIGYQYVPLGTVETPTTRKKIIWIFWFKIMAYVQCIGLKKYHNKEIHGIIWIKLWQISSIFELENITTRKSIRLSRIMTNMQHNWVVNEIKIQVIHRSGLDYHMVHISCISLVIKMAVLRQIQCVNYVAVCEKDIFWNIFSNYRNTRNYNWCLVYKLMKCNLRIILEFSG